MDSSINAAVSHPQVPVTPDKTASRHKNSTQTSTASRLPKGSVHSTPITARISSCASTCPRLTTMNVVLGHPDFFSSLLPELPADSDFSKSCLKRLSSDLWSEKTRRFEFTSSEQEKDMYGPLVDTLNAILEFRVTESASITSSSMPHPTSSASLDSWTPPRYEFVRVDQDFANRKVLPACAKGEPYYNCRPDIAMVLRNAPDSPTSWYDVALSIEVMRDPKKLAAEQAEDQADAILTNAPTKRFLYSFILCDSSLEICLCDRGGVITSERIDVNVNPHLFIEVVRQFASMSPVDLGFDETTIELPAGVGYPVDRGPIGSPIVSIQGEIYYRIQTLSGSSSSFGRSTRCFEARRLIKSKGTWSNETYLLKYFWNDVKRQPDEGKIYERIKKEGVKVGVAEFVSFVRLSKLSTIRRGLPLLNDYGDSDMEEYKMEGDEEQEDEGEEDEREQGSGEEDEGEEDKREQDEDEETTETEVELAGDRQLCVLVLASVGKSLSTPTTIYELISATKSAIKGHKEIYEKAGILHCDISTNNIRIRDAPRVFQDGIDEDPRGDGPTSSDAGFLIDFDLSLMDNCDDKSRSERLARTGTFCFMAWQILDDIQESGTQDEESPKGPLHSYKHDLQSFFWVLLYICAGSPSFTSKPLDRRHPSIKVMNIFSELKWEVASVLKKVYLTDRAKIWVAEPFKGMLSVLSRMQALLSPGNWDSLTHDAFISILDEALQDPNVQERALILQHKFEPPYLKPRYPTSGPIKTYQGPTLKSKHPGVPTLANHRSSASGLHMMTHSRTSKEPSGKEILVRNFVSRKRNADPPTYSRESKRSREA